MRSSRADLSGETFQFGPLAGIAAKVHGIIVFAEGAYMWRRFNSVDWDSETGLHNLPRSIDFSGSTLRFGLQFQFRKPDEKNDAPDSGADAG